MFFVVFFTVDSTLVRIEIIFRLFGLLRFALVACVIVIVSSVAAPGALKPFTRVFRVR